MPTIALVSARAARGLDEDIPPLEKALGEAGADVRVVDWDDERADWSVFDLAVIRSTWDYTTRLPEFLAWAERASAATVLLNALPIIRWNTDKHYLATLAQAGAPVIPSAFIEPGQDAAAAVSKFLDEHDCSEFVAKPAVGAGSRDVARYARSEAQAAISHAKSLIDANRAAVLQPYLDRVDEEGETALIYFAGRFSHAIRKGPLLRRGQEPVQTLFAKEHITARTPGEDQLAVGAKALAAIPFEQPLYARVDVIRDYQGFPQVLELELTEPSVFLDHAAGSAERFAREILARALPFSRSDPS